MQLSLISRLAAVVLVAAALSCVLHAEYPASRVRFQWDKIANAYPPPLYDTNRVVIKAFSIEVNGAGTGMQIKGEVWTDFEVEPGHGFDAGQMMGLQVDVTLLEMTSPTVAGHAVPGQYVTVKTTQAVDGLGLAQFALPAMAKPLPPGNYQLLAMVQFGMQDNKLKKALKWCPSWYGGWNEQKDGKIIDSGEVYGHPTLHDKYYNSLLNSTKFVKDAAILYVGNIRKSDGSVDVGGAGAENILCMDRGPIVTGELINYEDQRTKEDARYKKEKDDIAAAKKAPGADGPKLAERETRNEDNHKVFTKLINDNIMLNGGAATPDEMKEQARISAIKTRLSTQIDQWEDGLREKYWELVDCVTFYEGYQAFAMPGYNIQQAIKLQTNDDAKTRTEAMDKRSKDPIAKSDYDKKIANESWFYPKDYRSSIKDYYHTKDETDQWDSAKFTTKNAEKKIILDVKAWRAYVIKTASNFLTRSQALLDAVDCEKNFAVQKWPEAYGQAKAARDAVLSLGFTYEFSFRTNPEIGKEPASSVDAEFDELASSTPNLETYIKAAKDNGPSSKQTVVNNGIAAVKNSLKIWKYIDLYKKKLIAGGEGPK